MKAMMAWLGGLGLALATLNCQAGSLDLNLSDEAVQFAASGEVAPGIAVGGGLLDSEDRVDTQAVHAEVLGVERTRRYDIGVGARWTQLDTDAGDGGGLGLGGYGYAYVPQVPALSLGGYGFYTPGVVSAGDLERGLEYGLRARYGVTRNVDAYVGYRRLRADLHRPGGTRTLDSGAHAGVRLVF
ncbi:YfaZ family outer membrane protein [Halomonas sp. SL1]|uniref:YfaZ family outer membrane protein n=1 Tax=Halomonas sp. SL1 TaxID=2137478 RepID=UPI000D1523F7|nr:YfaZ family outer membrane protein [Halomonas sp. SL1]RAH37143.1 hypothetical protein C9J49_012160 [Halomonas sp. SL1]